MTDEPSFVEEHGAVAALLVANKERRERATAELEAARDELGGLLFRGQKATMEVADMAASAGVSRDTVHATLKEGGIMSWKQKQAWASQIMEHAPRDTFEQNQFRMVLQVLLYKALGSNPGEVPRSVTGVFEAAVAVIRKDYPNFSPKVDKPDQLASYAWPLEPFEIFQRGAGQTASFQLRQNGTALAPWRKTADQVARDLKAVGGERPAFIDRTGRECVTSDKRRIGWDVLRDV